MLCQLLMMEDLRILNVRLGLPFVVQIGGGVRRVLDFRQPKFSSQRNICILQ